MRPSHLKPDFKSLLVYETKELPRHSGMMREIHRVIPAPAELVVGMIGVPEGSDIRVDLTVESVVEGILVRGTAQVDLLGQCAKCLIEITDNQTYQLEELYFYPGNEQDEDDALIVDDLLDLEIVLRTAVVLELPFMPLCKSDCAGLCSECGADLNQDLDHSHETKIDSRWEKLSGLNLEDINK